MFEESVSSLPSIWASMNSWLTPTVLFVLLNLMIGTIAIASTLGTQKHQDQDQNQDQNHQQQHRELARSPSMLQRLKSINLYTYRSPEPATNYEKAPESETAHFFSFKHQTSHEIQQPQIARSPSMLQRLKSISSYFPREYSTPVQSRVAPEPEPEPEAQSQAQAQAQAQAHYGAFDHAHEEDEEEEDHEYPEEMEDHFEMDLPATPEPEPEQTLDEIYSQLHLHDHHVSRTTSDTKPASGEVPSKLPKKMKKSASAKSAFAHFDADDILETRRPATVREKKAKKVTEDEEVDAKADDFINRFKNQLKLQRIDSIIRYKDMINRGSGK